VESLLLVLVILGVQVLDHSILVLDVLLDALQVVRDLAVRLLLEPVNGVLWLLGSGQNVLDCVGDDEVLVRLQTQHGLLSYAGHLRLLVRAVVGEVANYLAEVVPGGSVSLPIVPVFFLRKDDGTGCLSPLRWPNVLPSPYSVCACSPRLNSPPRLAP
jgi:hypothetical protein